MKPALPILALMLTAGRAELADVRQVSARMAQTMSRERAALKNYSVLRHYALTIGGRHSAEMLVRMNQLSSSRTFEVLWEHGSNAVHKRVFHKLLEAEKEAAQGDMRITPANYEFHLEGMDELDGRRCYVLRMEPRAQKRYLLRGRVWVDGEDFAVVRVEGEPVAGSFWIKDTYVVQQYRKIGNFWLPDVNDSDTDVRIFGQAHLRIESLEYQIHHYVPDTRADAAVAPARVE